MAIALLIDTARRVAAEPPFAAAAGMEYRRGRASLALLYGVERYRFPAGAGPARREELAALTLKAGWSLKP